MRRKRPEGICHICGQYGPLSFEHIPPSAAFNDRRVISVKFEEAIQLGPDEVAKGPIQQRGAGSHTLCDKCNNDTGSWYGNQFVAWCYQGMDILIRSGGSPSLIYLNYLFPLPILKQIVTMFFSINSEQFRLPNEELVHFVLNKEAKYLSPRYRFFVYYNTAGKLRYAGGSAVMNASTGNVVFMSEITFPPFGYVMTLSSDPPDNRLFEITHFARYDYDEFAVVPLRLLVLPTYTAFPGDYRDKDQICKESRIPHKNEE